MNVDIGRRRMMTGMLVALPVGLFLVSCGGADSSAPPTSSGTQNIYTSSSSGGHTHTFGLDKSAIASPPAAGVTGPTSTDSGHSHGVTIATADLQSISAGQSVEITTTLVGGHTHVFTFTKIA